MIEHARAGVAGFQGVLGYRDSSGWGRAVTLAVAQWNAASVGVKFKPAIGPGCGDICIDSSPEAIDEVAGREPGRPEPAGLASSIGINPGERVTITLGAPPAAPLAPSGADIRLVIHELGHVLGLTHDTAACSVMNPDPQFLPECHRVGWFVSHGRAICGPARRDIRRAAHIWHGTPGPPSDPYCVTATSLDSGREETEYVRRHVGQITARALRNATSRVDDHT
jgi:hypothetical protein